MSLFVQLFEKNHESVEAARQAAREKTQPPKSREQAENGNYPKGKFWWRNMEIAIEVRKGGIRRDWQHEPPEWETLMHSDYGYIKRTKSEADKDHLDVFLGPNLDSEVVYVIDQQTHSGRFDEAKIMIGYNSEKEAREAYIGSYTPGWKGLKKISTVTIHEFKQWVKKGDTSVPYKTPRFWDAGR